MSTSFSNWSGLLRGARKTMFLSCLSAVEVRSKAVLGLVFGHGKSPCFSRWITMKSTDIDVYGSLFASIQMRNFHR